MKIIYIPIVAVMLMFTACGDKQDVKSHRGHHTGTGELQVALNDGQKWKMDEHTRSMFIAMTERLEAGGDINAVGKGLKSDLDKLIQGCTMTGEAHDQLHVFLMSFIPAVEEVLTNGSPESLKVVEELLHEYPKYFE